MRRPLRVLELRSVRGTGGGPEKTILLGAARHDAAEIAVTVCYLRDLRDEAFGVDARAREVGVDYVEVTERSSFDLRAWGRLRALCRERAIDVVHAHEYKTDLIGLWLARKERLGALATSHGWVGGSLKERIYYAFDKRVLRRYPIVIAVSPDIRDELVRTGSRPERVRVILNGIDAERFRRDPSRASAVRDAIGVGPADLVIGAVGRLEVEKRFDLLLRAVHAIRGEDRGRGDRLRVVICGEGSRRAELEGLAVQLGLDSACRFLGLRADVADLHNAFDLFVQTSDREGTSNAVLEAMALETTIVATRAGGTAELLRDRVDGLLVDCGDLAGVARAIAAVFDDPGGAAVRAASARRRVEAELSFAARTKRLEAIYRECADRRGRGGRRARGAEAGRRDTGPRHRDTGASRE